MIKEIYLFTNRNLFAFDEEGEQIIDVQKAIGWSTGSKWIDREREIKALERIIQDKPIIYLTHWPDRWKHEITIDDFCSLLGHGPWYWEKYKKHEHEEDRDAS